MQQAPPMRWSAGYFPPSPYQHAQPQQHVYQTAPAYPPQYHTQPPPPPQQQQQQQQYQYHSDVETPRYQNVPSTSAMSERSYIEDAWSRVTGDYSTRAKTPTIPPVAAAPPPQPPQAASNFGAENDPQFLAARQRVATPTSSAWSDASDEERIAFQQYVQTAHTNDMLHRTANRVPVSSAPSSVTTTTTQNVRQAIIDQHTKTSPLAGAKSSTTTTSIPRDLLKPPSTSVPQIRAVSPTIVHIQDQHNLKSATASEKSEKSATQSTAYSNPSTALARYPAVPIAPVIAHHSGNTDVSSEIIAQYQERVRWLERDVESKEREIKLLKSQKVAAETDNRMLVNEIQRLRQYISSRFTISADNLALTLEKNDPSSNSSEDQVIALQSKIARSLKLINEIEDTVVPSK